ncbi:MAG TPA: AAA family ATPase, partial [Actinomycetes bacterium]
MGRRREVQWALGQLAHGRTGIGGLVIHGMGGLGKSSLAARLAERLPQHRCLVLAGLVDEPALQQLVANGLGPEAAALVANSGAPLAQRLRRLLQAFPAPLLFLFDDFDPNLELSGAVPDLDSRGRGRLRPGATHVMQALAEAIRAQTSQSRVLITCRHPLALDGVRGRIGHLGLQGLQGDGLDKMIRRLPRISQRAEDDPVRARALDLAGGNPALLRRVDAALVGQMCDARQVVAEMEAAVDDFRTTIGVGVLYSSLPTGARTTLATLTVCRQPVDREVALLVTG